MNIATLKRIPVFKSNPIKLFIRLKHKVKKNPSENVEQKVSKEIVNYLKNNPEYSSLFDKIPKHFLRKYKLPESMYLINKSSANNIFKVIENHLIPNSPLIEINPGFCFLTEVLLKQLEKKIYVYESSSSFDSFLAELRKNYEDKVVCKTANFLGMAKLAFLDKIDQGNRVRELLGELATEDQSRILQIIGVVPGLSIMRYLLTTILFHQTTNLMGRVDLYVVMAAHQYEYLSDVKIQTSKFRQIPALFQIIFDCKVLGRVPKLHYLPWTYQVNKNISILDEDYMYIVNIKQKEKLPCHPEYLPMLWYFFSPHTISKSKRVIPMLEQWIPGCGVWLITGQDPPDTNKALSPNQDDVQLPHMTIFTEFGDLNLAQKLTVFKRFISWPDFDQCPYKVTMESNLPKFITTMDPSKELSETHIDVESDDTSDNESS